MMKQVSDNDKLPPVLSEVMRVWVTVIDYSTLQRYVRMGKINGHRITKSRGKQQLEYDVVWCDNASSDWVHSNFVYTSPIDIPWSDTQWA